MPPRGYMLRQDSAALSGRSAEERSLDSESDDALVERIARGSEAAWRVLVDRHLSSVHGYAWHILRDGAEAEDVAQETFLRLMKKATDWQPGGAKLKTWLYRVAINLCIDRRRAVRPGALDDAPEVVDTATGELPMARGLDLAHSVGNALQQLNERQRNAIVLVHYQGFTNAEAAEFLDLSVEAVESLLARARRALKQTLAPIAEDLLGER